MREAAQPRLVNSNSSWLPSGRAGPFRRNNGEEGKEGGQEGAEEVAAKKAAKKTAKKK
jgi:hypothetical protein